MCIICAHPLPSRIQWWWHGEKERDDGIDQTNINQSCIAEQFTLVWVREDYQSDKHSQEENHFSSRKKKMIWIK